MLRRVIHGASATVGGQAIHAVNNLLLVPLFLRCWPVALYGEWLTLYALASYLNNLDFGITSAAISAATMAYARGDREDFNVIQGTAWAAALALFLAGACIVAIFVAFFPVERWLALSHFSRFDAKVVVLCLALSVLLAIPSRQLLQVFVAIGQYPFYQWLLNSYSAASCLVIASLLLAGAAPCTVAMAILVIGLVTLALTALLLRRRDPGLLPRLSDANRRAARRLAGPSAWFGVNLVSITLSQQGPLLLINYLMGGGGGRSVYYNSYGHEYCPPGARNPDISAAARVGLTVRHRQNARAYHAAPKFHIL